MQLKISLPRWLPSKFFSAKPRFSIPSVAFYLQTPAARQPSAHADEPEGFLPAVGAEAEGLGEIAEGGEGARLKAGSVR